MSFKALLLLKHNCKNIILITSIFLASLLSQTFAHLFFKFGFKTVAIVLWVLYAIFTIAVFLVTTFFLHYSNDFYNRGSVSKFLVYITVVLFSFVIFTILFIVIRYIPSLVFLDFVGFPCVAHTIFSTVLLGASIFLIR